MKEKGIGGRILKSVASTYCGAQSHIDINGVMSDPFPVRVGVSQGDVISPFLFNIMVDTLLQKLRASGLGLKFGDAFLAALAYADDLVLCGTREEIKKYTEILDEWCEENHFKINVKKSQNRGISLKSWNFMKLHENGGISLFS